MKTAILAILLFSSIAIAQASDGINEAYEFCSTLSFSSDKQECANKVGQAHYIQEGALFICTTLSFSSDKIECIEAISDKTYRPAELHLCQEESFNSGKVECLANRGKPYDGGVCVSKDKISRRIGRALNLLDDYEVNRAKEILQRLQRRLERCD